jgi:hypothetical protein
VFQSVNVFSTILDAREAAMRRPPADRISFSSTAQRIEAFAEPAGV